MNQKEAITEKFRGLFIVRGRVVTNAGVAAKGLKVIAIDKNPGKEIVLGETITDSSGTYTISYKKEALQKMRKQRADIGITIVDPEEESKIYGASSVHFNADKDEEINLVLQTESVEKRSEYLQITSDLRVHLPQYQQTPYQRPKIGRGTFKDLQENKDRQDISYLANKTGWDARLVAMVSIADKYSAESGIPAEFHFALFRAGIPTDADGMYRTNSETVKKIWEKAVEENIIEASLKPTIDQNLAKFKESGRNHLLEYAKPVGVSSLKELLGISLPDRSMQHEFVELYFNHVGDMRRFWSNAEAKFGKDTADELQLDGKLGYLTVNNAELIGRLRSDKNVEKSPVDLIRNGLYKPEAWDTVLSNGIPVPKDMPGETYEEKKSSYINYMVSMLKISYPTSVVAEMVHNNELPAKGGSKVEDEVYKFLQDTHGKFEIGVHPVEKFITDNNLELGKEALNETKRLQRVYQVSPSDNAMKVLWDNSLDSALSIVQYDEKEFIETFGNDLGGEEIAKMTYAKAHQVHSTVLNIATSYLTYQTSPRVYGISGEKKNLNPHDQDLISYPTLEELFGPMDYCTCGHCKSVLSPAAYLVDLLQFIDRKTNEKQNPIKVLLERRPDIEHIQLTCENTNTVLPYIDLVNEILEYYVVNHTLNDLYLFSWDKIPGNDTERFIEFLKRNFNIDWVKADNVKKINDGNTIYASFENKSLSLRINDGKTRAILTIADGKSDEFIVKTENGKLNIYYDFKGHNVEEITSAELLASPQFVNDQAYTTLNDQVYPFNLPFNQPLSALRLYYDYLKVPLHEAMEKLRVNDNFDTPGGESYAWREIYNEFIGISQEEYKVLTDSEAKKLPVFFGEDENMDFDAFIEKSFDDDDNKIYNAKIFSRKTGITYNELIELIKTQFINPNSHLIPKWEKLRITFADIKKFKEGTLSDEDFENKIPAGLDRSIYGGDVKKWVNDKNNYDKIMSLILLTVSEGEKTVCEFDKSELRYSLPDDTKSCPEAENCLKEIDYWRLLRFIRLWRKLGWSIDETDKAITALYNDEFKPAAADNFGTQNQKLDNGFKDLIVKIAHVKKIKEKLNLKKENSLIKLLALWSNIDTHGDKSLYKQMFLQSSILKIDTVFDENGYGEYLTDAREMIKGHLLALEAAFNVTAEELSLILNDADFDENSLLSLENVSRIYRYSFLAKALKLSIQELITLKAMSGMDPFNELEDVHPSTLKFIELVLLVKQSGFKINTLNYFLQHEDATGKASPSRDSILSLAKTLKDGMVGIEQEYKVEDDPTGEIAKSKMALVYENDVVDKFFGFLTGTLEYSVFSVKYSYHQEELEDSLKINDKISYDLLKKRLIYKGIMTEDEKEAFQNAEHATDTFKEAIEKLFDQGQGFFSKFPELETLYNDFKASQKPDSEKFKDILEDFLPSLKKKLKHLFIKQTLSSSVNVDLTLLNELLEKQSIMHSIEQDDKPAIEDFLKPEVNGVTTQYFFADNTSTTPAITLSGIDFNRGTAAKSEFLNSYLVSKLLNKEIIKEVVYYTDYVYFSDSIKDESQLKRDLEVQKIKSGEIEQVLTIWRQTDNNLPANPAGANAKISAIWRFYLEVPANGNYNYYIETDSDIETDSAAEVKITIDENEILLKDDHGIWQNQDAIELKAGKLYRVELEIAKVKDKAVLKWESKGIGRESIPVKYLYPYEQVRNFSDMYIRLLKSIGILERLGLKEKEIAFFCTAKNISFQIDSKGFLNAIPVTPNPDVNKVEALFTILLDLLRYVELKRSLKVNDETLVTILNDPDVKDENGESLLLKVTGWDESSYEDLLKRFKWDQADDLSDLNKIIRVNEAFEVVNKFGVAAANLVNWTTNQPVAVTVRDIQNTLRAKYDESVWLTALQPINDKLRSRQRDALVSYILHEMQKNGATENIDTPDKLFEYFFIDVEMDPCMKTSRIKQANSTIQLFIQRCLMNLEPKVSPASINADQWEWMKRYRVWEANRKIFLYPENWLEPELRDNKSPFFRDLESELLQADITDELAETALLNYLEKLDDVSKLEISGMYLQEDKAILHVFGRTTGASRKYYYRRFEYGYWHRENITTGDLSMATGHPGKRLILTLRTILYYPLCGMIDYFSFG
jgi:DNA-binding transcriptional MerR regulator